MRSTQGMHENHNPSVIPAPINVIPASINVIPADAGTQRKQTTLFPQFKTSRENSSNISRHMRCKHHFDVTLVPHDAPATNTGSNA